MAPTSLSCSDCWRRGINGNRCWLCCRVEWRFFFSLGFGGMPVGPKIALGNNWGTKFSRTGSVACVVLVRGVGRAMALVLLCFLLPERERPLEFLIRDNDGKFTRVFDGRVRRALQPPS